MKIIISISVLISLLSVCSAEAPRNFRLIRNRQNNFLGRQELFEPYPASGFRPNQEFRLPNVENNNRVRQSFRNAPAPVPNTLYGPPRKDLSASAGTDNYSSGEERTENPEIETFDLPKSQSQTQKNSQLNAANPNEQTNNNNNNNNNNGAAVVQPLTYYIAAPTTLQAIKYQPLVLAPQSFVTAHHQSLVTAHQPLLNAQQVTVNSVYGPKTLLYTNAAW